jgi:hypothetical protein
MSATVDLTEVAKALMAAGVDQSVIAKSLARSPQVGNASASDDMTLNAGETGDSIAAKEGKVKYYDDTAQFGHSNFAKDDEGIEKDDEEKDEDEGDGNKPAFMRAKKSKVAKGAPPVQNQEEDENPEQDEDDEDGYGQQDDEENDPRQAPMRQAKTAKSNAYSYTQHLAKSAAAEDVDIEEWHDISPALHALTKSTAAKYGEIAEAVQYIAKSLEASRKRDVQNVRIIKSLSARIDAFEARVAKGIQTVGETVAKSHAAVAPLAKSAAVTPAPAATPSAPISGGIVAIVPSEETVAKSAGAELTGNMVQDRKLLRTTILKAARNGALATGGNAGKLLRDMDEYKTPDALAQFASQIPADWFAR